jgi:hypothetical protein
MGECICDSKDREVWLDSQKFLADEEYHRREQVNTFGVAGIYADIREYPSLQHQPVRGWRV